MMQIIPVCPHCGTVYHYRDAKNAMKHKVNTCIHCRRQFRVRMTKAAAAALIFVAFCIGVNILMLTKMEDLNLIALFAVTLVFLLLLYLAVPLFLTFEKTEDKTITKSTNSNKKSNRNK